MNPTLGWEQTTIATVLHDPACMEIAIDLAPQDFMGSNRIIWREILALHQRGALEVRALIEALRATGELENLGADSGEITGEAYLAEIAQHRGGQIEEYVRQVGENATRRQLRETAALIAADAMASGDKHMDEVLDEAERRIMSLRRARGTNSVTMAQILHAFMPQLEGMRAGTIIPAFVPTLQAVKDIIDYVDVNDLVLVAGRPGTGKSSYLRFEAFYKCKQHIPGLIFNLENTEAEYAKSFISLETKIDSAKLRHPRNLSNQELERVKEAATTLAASPLEILTLGAPSVAEIERLARARMRTLKPGYIMLDYIQLVNNSVENRVQDVSLTSQTLKGMTMKNRLNVPIICAAQLSRDIERRGARSEPQLADLRESGSLEQDASIVVFPREDWFNPQPPEIAQFPENRDPFSARLSSVIRAVPMRFYVLKNRNGPVGVSERVKWTKSTGTYETLVRE